MKKIIVLFVIILPFVTSAQEVFNKEKRDNIWLFGSFSLTNPLGANVIFDFNENPIDIHYEFIGARLDFTNSSVCDTSGNLLLYTNGISISNASHDTIENGGRINPGEYVDELLLVGNNLYQGALILPMPSQDSLYYIFYEERTRTPEISPNSTRVLSFYYAKINMNANNGAGKVLTKDIPIVQDTLDYGQIVATRHANGFDWWVMIPKHRSSLYYRILLTNEGIVDYGWYDTGLYAPGSLGQAKFSTTGNKYVNFSTKSVSEGQFLSIYDYNRCDGTLHNPIQITYNDTAFAGGAAISENARFLYIPSYQYIYQFDLEAEDVEASKLVVAEYDGFYSVYEVLQTRFFMAALAPDGKIYISANNSSLYLHVIHDPNKKGLACNVEQHGIELPAWNQFTMPNFPYYGLGPLDGSPCDTLNINNPPPEADFVYVVDSMEVHDISFYNSTLFSPEATDFMPLPDAYVWSFGDGEFSNERHPFHTYAEDGIYEVCLTATNMGGSDTFCDTLYINVVATKEVDLPVKNVKIHPNPVSEVLYLSYLSSRKGYTVLFDSFGREVKRRELKRGNILQSWDVRELASGVYYLQGIVDGQVVFSEKLVKM